MRMAKLSCPATLPSRSTSTAWLPSRYSGMPPLRVASTGPVSYTHLCRELADASLDSVQVTLYSADEAIHNTLVGALHAVQAGVRQFPAKGDGQHAAVGVQPGNKQMCIRDSTST